MKKTQIYLFALFSLFSLFSFELYSFECNKPDKKAFILSIDGGGIRGVIPAIILKYIEDRIDQPLCKKFDIIAGTSTGALIAAALSIPNQLGKPRYKASDILNMYKKNCQEIFKKSFWHELKTLDGWTGPKYESKYAYNFFRNILRDYHISETLTDVLIPALDLRSNKVKFFSTLRGKQNFDFSLHEIVSAATAAPTYFPSFKMTKHSRTYDFIDAGCVINNPSLSSYIYGLIEEKFNNIKNEDLVILSLGTGMNMLGFNNKEFKAGQGKFSWIFSIIDLMMNASSNLASKQSSFLFDQEVSLLYNLKNYFRIQIDIPNSCDDLDNCSKENIDNLEIYAFKAIEDNIKKIETIIDLLNKK